MGSPDSGAPDVTESSEELSFLRCLTKLAKNCKKRDAETFRKLVASLPVSLSTKKSKNRKATKTTNDLVKQANIVSEEKDHEKAWECDSTFTTKKSVKKHKKTCKKVTKTKTLNRTPVKCDVCYKVLSSKSNLQRHFKTQHEREETEVSTAVHPEIPSAFETYVCKLCKMGFYRSGRRSCHYAFTHKIYHPKSILCDDGSYNSLVYSFAGDEEYFEYLLIKSKKYYKDGDVTCRLCDLYYKDDDILKTHYMNSHKVDPSCLQVLKHWFRMDNYTSVKSW